MIFWTIAISLSALVAFVLAIPLLRGGGNGLDQRDADLQVYRDQLEEIETDLSRGVITESEAEAIRTEVSRRLLAADAIESNDHAGGAGSLAAIATVTFVLLGGLGAYVAFGVPGLPDQPLAERIARNAEAFASRPSQAEMERLIDAEGAAPVLRELSAEDAELLEQLRAVLETRPDDERGHRVLAFKLAETGNWREAAGAQAKVLSIAGDAATAGDFVDYAEFMILSANGYVSPEAEEALKRGLTLDPTDPWVRYYSGLTALQAGRVDLTYDLWTRLLFEGPADAPWVRLANQQIREVATAAGRRIPRGPDSDDIAAAELMAPDDRDVMIRGMVDGLADRLATEGGPAEDWARLIRALGVLEERARANEIFKEAEQKFSDTPADLALIRQAAQDAEILQ